MKRELNLIITTLNGYVIDRKHIIKNTIDMTVDDILNELFEKKVEFYGEKITYESLMGSYDDLEKFITERSNRNCEENYSDFRENVLIERYLTEVVGSLPDKYVGLEFKEVA